MIRRLCALVCWAAVAAGVAPAAATAGTYNVHACLNENDVRNNSWQSYYSNGAVAAYSECPGGLSINGHLNAGMVARNTWAPGSAPGFSNAMAYFDAPPGARIVRITGEINQNSTGGWQAGIRDMTVGRWLWCGAGCLSTFGLWTGFDIGGLSTSRVAAFVLCAQPTCRRDGLYALAALRNVTVVVADDNAPSVAIRGGSLVAGGWRAGVQNVVVEASDGVGVRGTAALIDGRLKHEMNRGCDATRAIPCPNVRDSLLVNTRELADGLHDLTVRARDAAGNEAQATRRIAVDNTAPSRPLGLSVEGGGGWNAANSFKLRWGIPRQVRAPLAGVSIAVCPIAHIAPELDPCTVTTRFGRGPTAADGIRVPGPGQWRARVWLRDAAGNHDWSHPAETILRFDDQAPTLSFLTPSPDHPALVRVKAQDVGSGLGVREILLRRRGSSAWTSLPVAANKSGFSAVVDDEYLPDGIYDLHARAVDLAGNERSTDRRADGKSAALALPLRIKTRLRVGKPKRVRAHGANGKRRYRIVLIEKPRSRYGRTIRLRGRLTSPGGNPLVGRDIEVLEQTHLPSAPWRPIATLHTSRTGRFTFRALRGPSRTVRFRYNGSDTIRGRTANVRLGVRAASSISVDRHRVVNGEGVIFRGRLRGRPYPAAGKLIEIQARARGRWLTFGTTRSLARTGRWSLPYRFSATRGTVGYRFRVRIPRESGYPYEMGTSRSVTVSVRGL